MTSRITGALPGARAIEVRDLHKYFGDNEVLKGIDFHVGQGQVVCVIGPSGSGKSTLLRCVNMLETPTSGKIFVSVANRDKRGMIFPIKRLADLGFEIVATTGTAEVLRRHGIACEQIRQHYEAGEGEDAVSLILGGDVALVVNTPQGSGASARSDGYEIRSAAVTADIPCITTVPGAAAAVMGIEARIRGDMQVRPLQELHAALRAGE